MSHVSRFVEYAAAFEKAYASDDWSVVEPFFAEEAVYDTGVPGESGRVEGREAILAYFKRILDGFDRRFDTRRVDLLEGPREEGDGVWVRGRAIYTAEGYPDLVLDLEELARFEGGRIVYLEDRYEAATGERLERYLAEHGEALGLDMS